MKVSISWLKDLVQINNIKTAINLLPLRTIGVKEVTDDFLELDMKGYNRADLLSMRGVAREVAAITDSKINFNNEKIEFPDLPKVPVEIQDENLSPVYCVAEIQNLKVEYSPDTWVKKLSDCGIRSINNVADVTNLVMLEYGQPMHAFDKNQVSGSIKVRVAKKGEKIVTLDEKNRNLYKDDLLIADEKGPIGIAGVMGGKDSEVSDSTTSILLEAAIFDPVSIRKTTKRHGLPSEAAKRFQHGLNKTSLLQALSAAIKMYEDLGGKLTAVTIVGEIQEESPIITVVNYRKVASLLGVQISKKEIENYFDILKFGWNRDDGGGNSWQVNPPFWRLDLQIEEDFIEEVARMYGYENIPALKLQGKQPEKIDQTLPNLIYDLKSRLADLGLTEVQTYSFYSSKTINDLRLTINDLIKIANPISSETEYMRNALWPNLVEVAAKNIKNGFKDIAIFEIGKIYEPPQKETYHLAIALMNNSDNPIQELNQIIKNSGLHLKGGKLNKNYFHPTRFTDYMAEVHPRIVNKFGIEQRIAVLEIEL